MKYLLTWILALLCSQLNAQNQSPMTMEDKKIDTYLIARKPATLTIQFKNLPKNGKKVDIKYTLVQLGMGMQTSKYGATDTAGVAKLVLDQNFPWQQIWLNAGNYLYAGLYINEGLTVTIDAQKTAANSVYMIGDGVQYSGPDGELNAVMNKNVLFKKQQREALGNELSTHFKNRKKLTTGAFFNGIDSIRHQLTQIDQEFIAGHPKYSWAVSNQTLTDLYGNLCVSYWGDMMPDSLFKVISKHQPYFTNNEGVMFYKYLQIYTRNQSITQKIKGLENTLAWYDLNFTRQKSDLLKLFFLEDEKDSFARSFPLIINSIQTKWCKRVATDELKNSNITQNRIDSLLALAKKIENANIGKPLVKLPFEAELYQIDTLKNVDEFILNLRAKFPKKALVIDFWATWCVPCLSDLPFSKSLHVANKDLPIEYIYLCTSSSSNIKIWKNKVAELEIPGTHIFVDEKIIAQLKVIFNATSGFPAYVVIDANGKFNNKAISRMENLNRDSVKQAVGL
jgi:thiol-disulfide isomerase/thioredoxin